jgi:hypothetical protein
MERKWEEGKLRKPMDEFRLTLVLDVDIMATIDMVWHIDIVWNDKSLNKIHLLHQLLWLVFKETPKSNAVLVCQISSSLSNVVQNHKASHSPNIFYSSNYTIVTITQLVIIYS